LPWYGGPFVKFGLLGFSLLTSLLTVIAAIVTPFIPLRKREADGRSPWLGRLARWTALLLCVLEITLIAFVLMVFRDGLEHTSFTSEVVLTVLPWVVAVLTTIVTLLAGFAWWKRWWGLVGRIHYTVIVLAALGLLWFEIYWRLIVI
jgi:cation transport ATPase